MRLSHEQIHAMRCNIPDGLVIHAEVPRTQALGSFQSSNNVCSSESADARPTRALFLRRRVGAANAQVTQLAGP